MNDVILIQRVEQQEEQRQRSWINFRCRSQGYW